MTGRRMDAKRFVKAVRTVMQREGISLEALKTETPSGFWLKVGKITGQKGSTAQVYWSRLKGKLTPEMESLLDYVDKVDHKAEPPRETAKVDTVDHAPEPVKDDMVDHIEDDRTADTMVDKVDGLADSMPVKDDKVDLIAVERMLSTLEDKLTAKMEERIAQAVGTAQLATVDKVDIPPLPPKDAVNPKTGEASGRMFRGAKGDLRARIDSELLKRLEAESKRLFAGNMSRAVDYALWNFFDRPPLSFQLKDADDQDPND